MPERQDLKPFYTALNHFEDAVKKHEHLGLVKSEVAARQEVDRARQALIELVQGMVGVETVH